MNSLFAVANIQKVLEYLIYFPGTQFLANDIQKKVKLSRGGVNQSLRELAARGYIYREKKGKIFLYSLNHTNPVVKQFKVLKNIEWLQPLIREASAVAEKIILFGSSARGEDSQESDLDIFILARNADQANDLMKKYKNRRKLQPIIRALSGYADMEKKEPVFYEEINRGITLWERKE